MLIFFSHFQRTWGMDIAHFAQTTDFEEPIKQLAIKVNIQGRYQAILDDWRYLLRFLASEPTAMRCSYSKSDPAEFWQNILPMPEVRPALKQLISSYLVIPMGSAEAERSFSVMNRIRTKARWLLKPATVEGLMFINIELIHLTTAANCALPKNTNSLIVEHS